MFVLYIFCQMADAMEMMILSILAPQLHCEWKLPSLEVALLTSVKAFQCLQSAFAWSSIKLHRLLLIRCQRIIYGHALEYIYSANSTEKSSPYLYKGADLTESIWNPFFTGTFSSILPVNLISQILIWKVLEQVVILKIHKYELHFTKY